MQATYEYVLDSSAWMSFFDNAAAAARVEEVLLGGRAATSVLSVAELSDIYHRGQFAPHWDEDLEFIETASDILPVSIPVASAAGSTKVQRRKSAPRFGLVDAIILETARSFGARLLTTDSDLRGMRGVEWHPR